MKKKKSYTKQTVPYAILLIVIIGVLVFFNLSQYKVYDYSYDEFIKKLSEGDVSKLEITPKNIRIRKKILDPTLRKRSKINNK